jgi:hypothetical protein
VAVLAATGLAGAVGLAASFAAAFASAAGLHTSGTTQADSKIA